MSGFWVIEKNKYVLQVTNGLRDSVCISRQIWQTVSPPTVCTTNGLCCRCPPGGAVNRRQAQIQATKENIFSTENTDSSLISMMSVV